MSLKIDQVVKMQRYNNGFGVIREIKENKHGFPAYIIDEAHEALTEEELTPSNLTKEDLERLDIEINAILGKEGDEAEYVRHQLREILNNL